MSDPQESENWLNDITNMGESDIASLLSNAKSDPREIRLNIALQHYACPALMAGHKPEDIGRNILELLNMFES